MKDTAIEILMKAQLIAGFATQIVSPNVPPVVRLNNQPFQSVAPSAWSVNYSTGRRIAWGFPQRKDVSNNGTITSTTRQIIHTTFTVGCLTGPNDIMSSSDLCTMACMLLSLDSTLRAFVLAGCNIFRIRELPGIWIEDDKKQKVLWSSFEVVFTHSETIITTTPAISNIPGNPQVVN